MCVCVCAFLFAVFWKFASLFPRRITILMVSIVPMLQRSLKNIASFIYDCPTDDLTHFVSLSLSLSLSFFVTACPLAPLLFDSLWFYCRWQAGSNGKVTDFGLRRKIKRASVVLRQSGDPCHLRSREITLRWK